MSQSFMSRPAACCRFGAIRQFSIVVPWSHVCRQSLMPEFHENWGVVEAKVAIMRCRPLGFVDRDFVVSHTSSDAPVLADARVLVAPMPGHARLAWVCVAGVVAAAFAVRFGVAVGLPSIERTDEVFQTLEPAHRLWSGWGIVTWEWRDGIRSWLFPGFLAGLMQLSSQLGLGPDAYLRVIPATLALLSLGVPVTGALLGWRIAGWPGAILTGLLCSFWPDLVYFGPKTLAEVQAGNILVPAVGLASLVASPARAANVPRRGRLCFAVGALLGVVLCLRFQLLPALLLVAIWSARRRVRDGWLPLLLGAALPVAALGLADEIAWGSSFQSVWKNLYVNVGLGRSDAYGVVPPYWYLLELAKTWGAALLPILVFFGIGARQAALPALAAAVIVLSHSLVAHKEISFIYAAIPLGMIVVGVGTARGLDGFVRSFQPGFTKRSLLAIATGGWLAVMTSTGLAELKRWHGVDNGMLALVRDAARRADLCGLGFYGADFPWNSSGGYTWLNRPVAIYLLHTPQELAQAQAGLDYLLVHYSLQATLPDYQKVDCAGEYCLLRRAAPSCSIVPALTINRVLERMLSQMSIAQGAPAGQPRSDHPQAPGI